MKSSSPLRIWFAACLCMAFLRLAPDVGAQENLVANPGFEAMGEKGFFAGWADGEFGKVGKTLFAETLSGAHEGKNCLRMIGTPHTWTTCASKDIPVKPNTNYWITWWFKAKQPETSRTYLFLQTNRAQRVFPHTDRIGDFDWTFNIVTYRTRPDETSLHPVLTMQTFDDPPGASWWDEVGVWEKLPPEMEAIYRAAHPWDDVTVATARRFAETPACVVWGDRAEARIYPKTSVPADAAAADAVSLTAPGRGHDIYQLVVTPTRDMAPVSLEFSQPTGAGEMPTSSLSYRVVRCVPVKEVRDKQFPLGATPDPLVEAAQPEPVKNPGESVLFWIEWAPPASGKRGVYEAAVRVLSGGKPVATVPLKLRRWGFDLPEVPHYRSMVMLSTSFIRKFYPGTSDDDAYRLVWDILSSYRLSGFNVAVWPKPTLKDGKLDLDWSRFDRIIEAAKKYRASAITLGPMFGGGCSQGWLPFKFCGLMPLADKAFDAPYIEMNRQMAERLRQAGLLDKAYVYPYDEPEPDYMGKIAALCDRIHQGAPDLKCLMTVSPESAKALWGKVKAWISPYNVRPDILAQRRAAGDEIWIYNMIAAIESPLLEHRLFMWRALRVEAEGGLLWNCCWWNKINPWENPTAAAVPVGRKWEQLYHYQAGQASLFYPDPAGKGPLVPALRLPLIRQGVEDFDIMTELVAAWRGSLARLSEKAKQEDVPAKARAAFIAPIMLDITTATTCAARAEAIRLTLGNELEAAKQGPVVIAYPTRTSGKLIVAGYAEPGAKLTMNEKPIPLDADGRFEAPVTDEELAAGLRWAAENGELRKTWEWAGLK